jgi:Zn-dependent peptidase ImmA (M78 family)
LHQDGKITGREAEDQANRFASFLMPKDDVLAELPYVVFLDQTMRKKLRWKVSVAALNYRGAICPTFLGGARHGSR